MIDPPDPHGPPKITLYADVSKAAEERNQIHLAEEESQGVPKLLPLKTSIFHFDLSKAAADPTYEGTAVNFISPTRLTERSTQNNSVYVNTRGCKINPKLIAAYIAEYFDMDAVAFKYERNKDRFEVNLQEGVDPAKCIYQSIPIENVALRIEKVYQANKSLSIVRLSDLPLKSCKVLREYIEEFFKPLIILEIMIEVGGKRHLTMGMATVVLGISEDPKVLKKLIRTAVMDGTNLRLAWKNCPFLCACCKEKGSHRNKCPMFMAKSHYGAYGKKGFNQDLSPIAWTHVKPLKQKQKVQTQR